MTNTDGANDRSVARQGDATCDDHHASVVRCVDAKELLARLSIIAELRGFCIERARRERLVDRDIDAADPGAVHSDMAHLISAGVDDGDVHRLADFARFGFRSGDYALCVTESNHDMVLQC